MNTLTKLIMLTCLVHILEICGILITLFIDGVPFGSDQLDHSQDRGRIMDGHSRVTGSF